MQQAACIASFTYLVQPFRYLIHYQLPTFPSQRIWPEYAWVVLREMQAWIFETTSEGASRHQDTSKGPSQGAAN